jgi:arginine/lysine/ornithine decarboxylase
LVVLGGASNAIRTALIAVRSTTGRILVQRNSHGSVIDGLVLAGLEVRFIDPQLDDELGIAHCLTPERVRSALQTDPAIGAVLVVSPTYFGAYRTCGASPQRAVSTMPPWWSTKRGAVTWPLEGATPRMH